MALTRLGPTARGRLTDDYPSRQRTSEASEDGGEGGNRTHHPAQSVGATVLKTVTTTRHVSLSTRDPTVLSYTTDTPGEPASNSPMTAAR